MCVTLHHEHARLIALGWLQVQLDGSVRTSGNRMPDFDQLITDLPPLDSLRSALMDGVGPQDE